MRSSFLLVLALLTPSLASAQVVTRNMQVLAHVNEYATPQAGQAYAYSACWAYVHPDGREYAVLGTSGGAAIYNVTTPTAPYRVAFIPGPPSIWREIKQYRTWIYIVTEGTGAGRGLQIIRMTDPESPVLAATYTSPTLVSAHTVAVDTSRAILILNGSRSDNGVGGYPYQGMQIFSIANPESPALLGVWPVSGPYNDTNYIHDSAPVGNRLYASSVYAGVERVFDFSDPAHPQPINAWTYPGAFYTHNSWPDSTATALYVTDEHNGQTLRVFDIHDLAQPVLVSGLSSNPVAIVHNAHVRGGELYLSNYTEGIRVLDLADPLHPAEYGWADSYPGPSGGYGGVWEVCPFFPSGIVVAGDMMSGLWVYRPVRDYGSLRVSVIDGDTQQPLDGVRVRLTSQGDSLVTFGDGIVRFAPSPGTHTVVADRFGWTTATATRPVVAGASDSVTLALTLKPVTSWSGVVRDRSDASPLDDADIALAYTSLRARSAAAGDWRLDGVPEDDYRVGVHRPGYVPLDYTRHIGIAFPNQDFDLTRAAAWDSLETAGGWTVGGAGDNATGGAWVLAAPVGTGSSVATEPARLAPTAPDAADDANGIAGLANASFDALAPRRTARSDAPASACGDPARAASMSAGACVGSASPAGASPAEGGPPTGGHCGCGATCVCGVVSTTTASGQIKPWADRTPGTGSRCFVTGQAPNHTVNPDQVDLDGRTTLTSPAFDVTFATDPVIGYWRWLYSMNAGTGQPDADDWLAVLISNDGGASWTSVDTLRGMHNAWEESAIHVKDFVPPSAQVRVRFVAADLGAATTAEAAIDDVTLYDGALAAVNVPEGATTRLHFDAPWPNPARGAVHLVLAMPGSTHVALDVVDIHGRAVRRLHDGPATGGRLSLVWDGRDDRGHAMAAGVYFAVARSATGTARARIVHLP